MNLLDDTRCSHCHGNIMAGAVVEISHDRDTWKCPACERWNVVLREEKVNTLRSVQNDDMTIDLYLKKTNPILNPNSKHYAMFDGFESVERMEQMYTKEDMMVFAKITAMKYRLRIGNKDDVVKEAEKIKTYEDYYVYLEGKLEEELNED